MKGQNNRGMILIRRLSNIHKGLFLVVFLLSCAFLFNDNCYPKDEKAGEISYEFSQDEASYSFRGEFLTQGKPACLIHVLYDFKHQAKIMTSADSVVLLREGDNWYEVSYHYSGWFFSRKSTYRITLKPDKQEVTFKLIGNEQHGPMLPEIQSSEGYYKIQKGQEGCRVIYFQTVRSKMGVGKSVYLHKVKKNAIKFMKDLRNHVKEVCG